MRRLGELGFALLGVWIAASSATFLSLLSTLVNSPRDSTGFVSLLLTLVPFFFGVLLGLAVVVFRRNMSVAFFDDDELDGGVEPRSILALGLMLIGVSVTISGFQGALRALSGNLARAFQMQAVEPSSGYVGWLSLKVIAPGIVVELIVLAVGVALVLNARRLAAKLWPEGATDA